MIERKPIPRPEYVNFAGRAVTIDHKWYVRGIERKAWAMELEDMWAIYDFDERGDESPDEEMSCIGTGPTEAAAWRDAHLFLTEPEECHCPAPLTKTRWGEPA